MGCQVEISFTGATRARANSQIEQDVQAGQVATPCSRKSAVSVSHTATIHAIRLLLLLLLLPCARRTWSRSRVRHPTESVIPSPSNSCARTCIATTATRTKNWSTADAGG